MQIRYHEIFWLFMLGNILGVAVEGVWCRLMYGRWETHTVALWGPFNLVYGLGASVLYVSGAYLAGRPWAVRLLLFALLGSAVEYLCGLVIRVGIGMKAWDYSNQLFHIQGLISPRMALMWGVLGFGFDRFLRAPLQGLLRHMTGGVWDALCAALTVFMAVDLALTAACILRWAGRHWGKPAGGRLGEWIDRHYPDWRMRQRFYYWQFLDEPDRPSGRAGRRYPEDFMDGADGPGGRPDSLRQKERMAYETSDDKP